MTGTSATTQHGLAVSGVSVRFGGVAALTDVTLEVAPGTVHGLIGPNGAGKTSLFNCVTGLYGIDSGQVVWQGRRLDGMSAPEVAATGVARTFQNLALFDSLTVRQNVLVGLHRKRHVSLLASALGLPSARREATSADARAREALAELNLAHLADRPASDLPYGLQKQVELARALVAGPSLLLLDEPAAGLSDPEVSAFSQLLLDLRRDHDLTLVVVEHRMDLVMEICDVITVLNYGEVIVTGTPDEVRSHPAVVEAYLGTLA